MAITVPIVSTWDAKGIDKSVRDIQRAEGGWAKAGKAVEAATVPAAAALGGLAFAGLKAVKAAEESATANAALSNVFKQMGYPENTKAAQAYADELSRLTGIDDEAIISAQTKLATFSEVAKSTDTMAQATRLAADLQAAGFGDMASTSVMLGKALQDPVKGINAMARVGVTFTEEEKAMAKAMVEAGDAAGAQALIMDALEKQVGGTAEATANDSDKMAVAWGNLTEEIGAQLLPAFERLTEIVLAATAVFSEHSGLIVGVGAAVAALATAVLAINAAMKVWTALTVAYNAIQLVLNSRLAITAALTLKATAAIVAEKVAMVASTAAMVAKNAIMLVIRGATLAYTAAQWALNAALTANPIGLVIVAVVALVAAIVLAYKKSETFRNVVGAVFSFLKSVLNVYIGVYIAVFRKMWEWAQKIIDKIQELARKVKDAFTIRAPSWLGGIFSSSAGTLVMGGAGVLATAPATAYGRVTINVYGDPDPYATARTVKRALEGYDISMGRAPGTPMAKAW